MLDTDVDNIVGNEEKGEHGKDVVTPLVRRGNEGTDKSSHDHDLIHQDGVENGRPWETSSQEDIHEKQLRKSQFAGTRVGDFRNLLVW